MSLASDELNYIGCNIFKEADPSFTAVTSRQRRRMLSPDPRSRKLAMLPLTHHFHYGSNYEKLEASICRPLAPEIRTLLDSSRHFAFGHRRFGL
jgi:hypothetical protein